MKKIACLFPGIGYTCDKPLLYYSAKLLKSLDWEVLPVPYSGFPEKVRGDKNRMEQCAQMALSQAEELLKDIPWNEYDEILFIGKSVGTVACTAYAKNHSLCCKQILFTPVEETFRNTTPASPAIAFHGTKDPWAENEPIESKCKEQHIPLYETEGANHSLETGDVEKDLKELRKVMKIVREYVVY